MARQCDRPPDDPRFARRCIPTTARCCARTRRTRLDVDELPLAADGTTDLRALEARLADGRYAAVALQSPNFFGGDRRAGRGGARAPRRIGNGSDRRRCRSAFARRACNPPGIVGRADRRRRSAVFGVAARLRRSVRRLHRRDERTHAPHSRTAGRADRSTTAGRTAYVLTLAGARAAHPPRTRDLEHLHQSSALRADRDDLSRAALGKTGLRDAARRSTSSARAIWPNAVTSASRLRAALRGAVLQRVRRCDVPEPAPPACSSDVASARNPRRRRSRDAGIPSFPTASS